jgi:ribose transport system ATP-binding protein
LTLPPLIEATEFAKTFGSKRVLEGVDLVVRRGEIHALVGQNGSGKSTFIKILSGYHAPDSGAQLAVRGRHIRLPLDPGKPAELLFRFVHQDLGLFEEGSVLENLLVGRYHTRGGWRIAWADERRRGRAILEKFGLEVNPMAPLATLGEVERAILAIARAVWDIDADRDPLLVLDEPTARLPKGSVETFFSTVRSVASQGAGVLFVSHRLDEVLALADRVTVLRDGKVVASRTTDRLSVASLVGVLLGTSEAGTPAARTRSQSGDVVLSVRGLSGATVHDFNIDIRRGEIVGVTGLVGMGHDALPHLLFGSIPATSGHMQLAGQSMRVATIKPHRAMQAGLALIPGNRQRDGAAGTASVAENMTLATIRNYFRGGLLRKRDEIKAISEMIEAYDVRPAQPEMPMNSLSGGNQQKSLIAKWVATNPRVLLLDEPTHGVDVGAKGQIMQHLRSAAADGMAILLSSVEVDDLAALCDRVLVLRHGRVVSELRGDELEGVRIAEHAVAGPTSSGGQEAQVIGSGP